MFKTACAIVTLFFFFVSSLLQAQCISVYPNTETFETSAAWTSGGNNNDWAWGSPAKPVITGAGGGVKCWITGGLTASFYNYSEQSYIVSPCYDFTSLAYPHVTFKIFWECEHKYDGGNLQYSVNGGTTWINVGAYGNPVDCMDDNWFNNSAIVFLNSPAWISPNDGWSGNIQSTSGSCQGGSGSGAWKTAQHCLNGLAGQPNVLFRFTFGAGTLCNSYDGFAIDDFTVEEGIANAPHFTYTCSGTGALSFTSVNPPCPTPSSYSWNFGDPASGASNTSTAANPSHTFSAAGTYTVTLTTSGGPCNPPGSISHIVSIMGVNIASQTNVSCFGGNNGSASATASGGNPSYTYSWSNGATTSQITNLTSQIYTITVTDSSGCKQTATVSITQPPAISITATSTQTSCIINNGTATANAGNGAAPYFYNWSNGQTSQTATWLGAGTYTVIVTDSNGCSGTDTVTVTGITATVSATAINISTGSSSTLTAAGGSFYSWSPPEGLSCITCVSPIASPSETTTYCVFAVDSNGCNDSACITIDILCGTVFLPNAFSPNEDGENDVLKIYGNMSCIKSLHLLMYDRWGEKVFETNEANFKWDGTHQGQVMNTQALTYFFSITFIDDTQLKKKGNISLIR